MRRSPITLFAIILPIAGCAATPEHPPRLAERCDVAPLQSMTGQAATAELAADAMRRVGARTVRWKTPNGAVTMDYRPDRLNISVDADNRVTGFDCG